MATPLRVLIVEDSENDAILAVRELEISSYDVKWTRVETAPAMRMALDKDAWDVVIADFTMPQFSAPAALKLLQEVGIDLPFIIVSGSVGEDIAVKAMQAGAHDYLVKGNLKRLAPAVQRELREAANRRARRHADAQYSELVALAPIGIYRVSRDGRVASANVAMARLLGYDSPDELLPLDMQRDIYYDFADRPRLLAELDRAERIAGSEVRLKRRDGSPIWVQIDARAVRTGSGGFEYLEGFVHDIDERKKAEEALRQSEERYRSLIESSRDVVTIIDPGGTIRFASPSIERVAGYRPEELAGQNAFSFVHPEDAGRLRARFAEILVRETRTVPVSFRFRHRDGTWRVFEAVGNSRAADPQVGGVVLNSRDVTEIRQAEEALRQSEERFHRSFSASPVAMSLSEPGGLMIDVNAKLGLMLGYDRNELIGHSALELGLWADPQERLRMVADVAALIPIREREIRLRTKQGEVRCILDSIEPLRVGEEYVLLSVFQDITERKRSEDALRKSEEQLRQAQKMEAVGQLAGGIAHDFNNLLTVILGFTELAAAEIEAGNRLTEPLEEIRKAGERAASLTRQLLAFSRRQVLDPKVLDLNALVENLERMLRRLIGEDVALVTVLDPGIGSVRADAGQVEQVIMNLAVNARDAMPRGGKLTIETRDIELDNSYARDHATVRPGTYVMLAVTDSGTGMSAETKAHMFEPFFTTKGKGKGTGLGLATVYGIVKQSGGNIWVYSEIDRGTVFKVYFPRVTAVAENVVRQQPGIRPIGGSETVLLVEDEPAVRTLTRKILEGQGYSVLEVESGARALETARRHTGSIHLLVTDVVMPEVSGPDLAAQLLGIHPAARVLFMSGYTDDAVVRHGILAEGMHFLQKPFTPGSLARKVREVLDAPKAS
jgi:two-component system cell cycle sensor histidine kinase/response regulator CckA